MYIYDERENVYGLSKPGSLKKVGRILMMMGKCSVVVPGAPY